MVMEKARWGGLRCSGCGSDLQYSIGYTGADWECEAGEGSGYGYVVALACERCGRMFPICHVKHEGDASPVRQE